SRLIALENKCSLQTKAHKNIVKNRIRFLFLYLDLKKNKKYDYKDVKAIYTPNIPSDDLSTAQMLSQLPEGLISKDTGRGLFSFINNVPYEGQKVQKEQKSETEMVNLDKIVGNNEEE
ncbi:phage portal protein, partial [Clostridium sp.]